MPAARKSVPAYLLHKQSGRARVVWTDANGVRRDKLLPGAFKSPESRAAYGRVVAELAVDSTGPKSRHARLTVAELLLAFLKHAEQHYRDHEGRTTGEYRGYKRVIREVRSLYEGAPATEFGPVAMKAVRHQWVAAGLARLEVNRRTNMLRRVFKWAASEELVPASVYQSLTVVSGLQKGRTPARETEPVRPVVASDVDATLRFMKPHARALIEFMRLTGCRPGEACQVRPCDLDTTSTVWQFKPSHHKNTHRGKSRVIAIGPKSRALLEEFAPPNATDYFFSPRHDVQRFREDRRESRVTPLYDSHVRRIKSKRVAMPKRSPSPLYSAASLGRAVSRAVDKANAERERSFAEIGPNLPLVTHWHPNQLRHAHATEVRKRFGLEAAQVALGHARADVTQIYAEKNGELATAIAIAMS